ncbi:NACHT domain-containing protein [Paractinoplanes rishiriensis]|uniref:NACHT domain-containing protein n=1 Tax=Paractinoplanes rishiriensis TaxID=1050105 RepID=UPI001943C41C|nr:NACHT domain-containing protein [Actinoplanes rishiriensis]
MGDDAQRSPARRILAGKLGVGLLVVVVAVIGNLITDALPDSWIWTRWTWVLIPAALLGAGVIVVLEWRHERLTTPDPVDLNPLLELLPPQPAGPDMMVRHLESVERGLDTDVWTRRAGSDEITLRATAQRLSVEAYPDRGYDVASADREVCDALELVARCDRVVLVGGPGAGKTWLARRIAIDAARAAVPAIRSGADPESVEIPLFVRCSELPADSPPDWAALVMTALRTTAGGADDRALEAVRRRLLEVPGRYLVVLDGLDESPARAGQLLDQLTMPAQRTLRIVVTSRAGSWRRQLALDAKSDRHRIAELRPLRFPEDVTALVNARLADRPQARERVSTWLRENPGVAEMARTPLLCLMYCLIAERGGQLPAGRASLYGKVVRRLLDADWRAATEVDLNAALTAVRELAWAAATDEEKTGLAAWREDVPFELSHHPWTERVRTAVANVAPALPYDPDARPRRQFLHPSIREYLVAEHAAQHRPPAEVEPHLWYDSQWTQVLPLVLSLHEQRDDLLRRLLAGDERSPVDAAAIDRRDGFGELRGLLRRLAVETSPEDWRPEQVHLINLELAAQDPRQPGQLVAAANGWAGARPGQREIDRLIGGELPWRENETPEWIGHLRLQPEQRQRLVTALVETLASGKRIDGVLNRGWEPGLAAVLDAVQPAADERTRAIDGLNARLRQRAYPSIPAAVRALGGRLDPGELAPVLVDQLRALGDTAGQSYLIPDVVETIRDLRAEEAVDREVTDLMLARLDAVPAKRETSTTGIPRSTALPPILDALTRCRLGARDRVRVITVLLERRAEAERWRQEMLLRQVERFWPADSEAGEVLTGLGTNLGPWRDVPAVEVVLSRLTSRAAAPARAEAADEFRRRLPGTPPAEVPTWARWFRALDPPENVREAVVDELVGRRTGATLPQLLRLADSVEILGCSPAQSETLVSEFLARFDGQRAEARLALCEAVHRFSPAEPARSATVQAAITVAGELPPTWAGRMKIAMNAMTLNDQERRQLAQRLTTALTQANGHHAMDLARMITWTGVVEQRLAAAEDLAARIETEPAETAVDLGWALRELQPTAGQRSRIAARFDDLLALPAGAALNPYEWIELLPDLTLSASDQERLLDVVLPKADAAGAIALVAALDPDGVNPAVTERLFRDLPGVSDFSAAEIAQAIADRKPDPKLAAAVAADLLVRLQDSPGPERMALLEAVTRFDLAAAEASSVVTAAEHALAEGRDDISRLLAVLDAVARRFPEASGAVIDTVLARIAGDVLHRLDEPTAEILLRIGLDGPAVERLARRLAGTRRAWSVLRDLAAVLRRTTTPTRWLAILDSWAAVHPRLRTTEPLVRRLSRR